MQYRVAMKINTPGRSGLDHIAFEVPFFSAHYSTLDEAVEVIDSLRQTVADKAVSSYGVQQAHPGGPWRQLQYSEWSDLMKTKESK